MTESEKKVAAAHLKAIHEHHAKAKEHHAALTQELNKDQPDPANVREHAAQIHHHVTQAQTSHRRS
jgi:predicted GNAT superfamily acetyltransferase